MEIELDDTTHYKVIFDSILSISKQDMPNNQPIHIYLQNGDWLQIITNNKSWGVKVTSQYIDEIISLIKRYNNIRADKKTLWLHGKNHGCQLAECDITKNHNSTVRANTNKEQK